MGLDAVELIMGVEEAFDIEIPDEAAAEVHTVGQMYELVLSKLALTQSRPQTRPRPCPSSVVFYQTRRTLMDMRGVPRRSIAPSTAMETLMPLSGRRGHWENLCRTMGVRLPDLEVPSWMGRLLSDLKLVLVLSSLFAYLIVPVTVAALYSMGSVLLMWAAQRIASPFAVRIPARCATVGGTVNAVVRLSYGIHPQTGRRRTWTPDEVWETLRQVIVEQLDIPPEAVTPDAYFVDDLGAD